MLLADSCFNFTHDSFKNDLDSVINDLYDENIGKYPGVCDRSSSEQFIKNNASTIEID